MTPIREPLPGRIAPTLALLGAARAIGGAGFAVARDSEERKPEFQGK